MRILKGSRAWWCLHGSKIAQLPPEAVAGRDEAGRPVLVEVATRALTDGGFFAERARDTYGLTVLTSTACNLGCGYCFQNTGTTGSNLFAPDRIPQVNLAEPVIDAILAFTRGKMAEAGLTKLKVLLFGGEPLLSAPACVSLLHRAADLGLTSAAMVSNGVLLTVPLARRLTAAGLRATQITFDGDQDTHDRIRVTRNGRGTFDTILRNVAAVSDAVDMNWQFRINVSHRNANGVPLLLNQLAQRVKTSGTVISIALVDDVGIGYDNRVRHTVQFAEELLSWHRFALDLGFLVRPPLAGFDCDFCSAKWGRTGAVVNADGSLYSCWESVGQDRLRLGDVRSGYDSADEQDPRWVSCGYNAAGHGDQAQSRLFQDTVDAGLLDELAARGALPGA